MTGDMKSLKIHIWNIPPVPGNIFHSLCSQLHFLCWVEPWGPAAYSSLNHTPWRFSRTLHRRNNHSMLLSVWSQCRFSLLREKGYVWGLVLHHAKMRANSPAGFLQEHMALFYCQKYRAQRVNPWAGNLLLSLLLLCKENVSIFKLLCRHLLHAHALNEHSQKVCIFAGFADYKDYFHRAVSQTSCVLSCSEFLLFSPGFSEQQHCQKSSTSQNGFWHFCRPEFCHIYAQLKKLHPPIAKHWLQMSEL